MLGVNNSGEAIYLSVAYGRLRMKTLSNGTKVTAETENAVSRKNSKGEDSWAIEYDFVKGDIEKVFRKEGGDYDDRFEIVITDGADRYRVSLSEGSRFCNDFLKKLPNIDFNKSVILTPYDFESKTDGKRRVGISIEQEGNKIKSYYSAEKNGKWELLYGYPSGDGVDWGDKDEIKMYGIKVKKFLREEFEKRMKDIPEKPKQEIKGTEKTNDDILDEEPDDLPF